MRTSRKWITIDADADRRLAVSESGHGGVPFLWGHGLQCSMRADDASGVFDWSGLAPAVRVIRYDARAHGESCSEWNPRACAWENLARDMWRVADGCGLRKPVLGGASMGCATALWAAVQQPARVAGLVLVIPPTGWEMRPRQARAYRLMARLVRLTGNLPFKAATALIGTRASASGTPLKAIGREVLRGLATRDPKNVVTAFEGAVLSDLPAPERCAKLAMPTLILAWPDDPAHPLEIARRLERLLPKARLEVAHELASVARWPAIVAEFIESVAPRATR